MFAEITPPITINESVTVIAQVETQANIRPRISATVPATLYLAAAELNPTANLNQASLTNTDLAQYLNEQLAAILRKISPTHVNSNFSGTNGTLQEWWEGNQDVLSYYSFEKPEYKRNRKNILTANGIDLSGVSLPSWMHALNPPQQQLYATAISPRHVIAANHWHPTLNQPLLFLDNQGKVVIRQITASKQVSDPKGGLTDLWLGVLNEDLPDTVAFFKSLPGNYKSYLKPNQNGIPVWISQGGLIINANSWHTVGADDSVPYQPSSKGYDINGGQHPLYTNWGVGHGGSGSPIFIIIDKKPVLVSLLHYMGGTTLFGGPSVADLSIQINAAMAELQGGAKFYQLTPIDLSAFAMTPQ